MVTCRQFFRTGHFDKIYNDETMIHIYIGDSNRRVASGHWYNDSIIEYLASVRFEVSYYKKEDFMNGHTRLDVVIDRL